MYLDEQPITTIQGALDVHLYDIARVEALAGPQGTLYGASSQAGTIRIITQQARSDGVRGGLRPRRQHVLDGDDGYVAEGFVNLPIGESAAVRLVGWKQARRRLHRQRVPGRAPIRPAEHHRSSNAELRRRGLQRRRHDRRARGAAHRSERQLDDHAARSWTRSRRRTARSPTIRRLGDLKIAHAIGRSDRRIAGRRRRSRSKARSPISTSSTPARI